MNDILFAAALPFVLTGIAYGLFYLGRVLAEWALARWHRVRRR